MVFLSACSAAKLNRAVQGQDQGISSGRTMASLTAEAAASGVQAELDLIRSTSQVGVVLEFHPTPGAPVYSYKPQNLARQFVGGIETASIRFAGRFP